MFPYPAFSVGFLFFFLQRSKNWGHPRLFLSSQISKCLTSAAPFNTLFFFFYIPQWTPRTSFPPHQKHWPGARCSHREHSACFSLYSTIFKKCINEPGYFCFNILAFLFQFPLLLHSELISAAFLLFSGECLVNGGWRFTQHSRMMLSFGLSLHYKCWQTISKSHFRTRM